MNDDVIDSIKYYVYRKQFDEVYENTINYGRKEFVDKIIELQQENNRLLELCMYALINDTKMYSSELANDTKQSLIEVIKNNLNEDTHTLRKKLIDAYENQEQLF